MKTSLAAKKPPEDEDVIDLSSLRLRGLDWTNRSLAVSTKERMPVAKVDTILVEHDMLTEASKTWDLTS